MDATAARQRTASAESGARADLWLIVFTIVTVSAGILFRFSNIDGKVCWVDECMSRVRVAGFLPSTVERALRSYSQPINVDDLKSFMHSRGVSAERASLWELLREDFQVCPVYYQSARLWSKFFGGATVSLRYFCAITSLLALPLLYLLALELFRCRRAACLALCLGASSPIFLIYAQQHRHYSIWIVTLLLACLTLLRAIRLGGSRAWAGYSVSLAISFLANPLSVLVTFGQAAFVFLRSRSKLSDECKAFVVSVTFALLAFVPRLVLSSFDVITGRHFAWLNIHNFRLGKHLWAFTIQPWTRLFWDSVEWGATAGEILMSIGLTCMVLFSVYYVIRRGSREQRLFVLALILPTICLLAARDVLFHQRSLTITRYMFPVLIGVQLAVAFLFARKTATMSGSTAARAPWTIMFVAVTMVGFHGCARLLSYPTTWAGFPVAASSVPEASALINNVHRPVVLIPCERRNGLPLSLCDRLKSDARIIPVNSQAVQWHRILQNELRSGGPVFLWDPEPSRLDEHLGGVRLSLQQVDTQKKLWRVKP